MSGQLSSFISDNRCLYNMRGIIKSGLIFKALLTQAVWEGTNWVPMDNSVSCNGIGQFLVVDGQVPGDGQ